MSAPVKNTVDYSQYSREELLVMLRNCEQDQIELERNWVNSTAIDSASCEREEKRLTKIHADIAEEMWRR